MPLLSLSALYSVRMPSKYYYYHCPVVFLPSRNRREASREGRRTARLPGLLYKAQD